jgi:hypothetical protein
VLRKLGPLIPKSILLSQFNNAILTKFARLRIDLLCWTVTGGGCILSTIRRTGEWVRIFGLKVADLGDSINGNYWSPELCYEPSICASNCALWVLCNVMYHVHLLTNIWGTELIILELSELPQAEDLSPSSTIRMEHLVETLHLACIFLKITLITRQCVFLYSARVKFC